MKSNRKSILGLFLILLGVLFLLNNLGQLPPIPEFIFSWPMLLIAIGLFNLLTGNGRSAIILFAIGGFFLLQRFTNLDLHTYWPVILVVIGLSFLFKNKSRSNNVLKDGFFDDLNVFGGSEKKFVSDPLEGGKITTIFGGTEIDLSESKPVNGATIEVFTMFGGCDITIPDDWQVHVDTVSIFGGFSDKRRASSPANPVQVTIKGFMIFGGGELKSK